MIFRILSVLLMINTVSLQAQNLCELDSVKVVFGNCNEGFAEARLSFVRPTLHSDQFQVRGNGKEYGTFFYESLPVNLGLIRIDKEVNYEFIIQDVQIDTCLYVLDYGQVSCTSVECSIRDLATLVIDSCTDGATYKVLLDFKAEGAESFNLYVNGEFHSDHRIEQLPVIIEEIPASGKRFDVLKVFVKEHPDCYQIVEVEAPNCLSPCGFYDFYVKPIECDDTSFYVKIGLEHVYEHSDTFSIKGNGVDHGLFLYESLPIILGPFISGETETREFILQDFTNPDCIQEAIIDGSPCKASCSIEDLSAQIIRCDSGTFDVSLNFSYQGDLSDSFRIKGNGRHYGYYSYEDLPVTVSRLEADGRTPYEFVIYDQERWDCSTFIEFGKVDCQCRLPGLEVGAGECTSDSTYLVEFNFEIDWSDTFDLYTGHHHLGTFPSSELPLRLEDFPASGKSIDELFVCLNLDTFCCIPVQVEAPACAQTACQISNLTATPLECHGGEFYVKIGFEKEGPAGDFFIVKGNGDFIGEYKYGELPLKAGPFKDQDGTLILDIYDAYQDNCHEAIEVEAPGCGCDIGEIKVDVGECTSDTTYLVKLDIEMEGNFDFYINGHFFGTFDSDDLPRVFDDFPASGGVHDYLKICGVDSSDCCKELKITAPSCAWKICGFENISYEITECNPNNQFYVLLKFDTVGTHSETFIVQQGEQYFEYPYSEYPTRVGPFQGGAEFYKLKICDGLWHDCHADVVLGRVVCEGQCDISGASIKFEECVDGDQYILSIDSVVSSFEAFDIYHEEKGLGFYKKRDLPWRLKVPIIDADSVTVSICVSDNVTCCYRKILPLPYCGEQACDLADLRLDTLECRGDSLWLNLTFDVAEVDDSAIYILKINGKEYSQFYYDEVPLHIGPFLADEKEVYEIGVKSLFHPDCRIDLRVDGLSCPANHIPAGNKLLILESVENKVYVRVPEFISERTDFDLVDLNGRILHNVTFSTAQDRAVIQIPFMTSGMYLVRMRSAAGETYVVKVIMP